MNCRCWRGDPLRSGPPPHAAPRKSGPSRLRSSCSLPWRPAGVRPRDQRPRRSRLSAPEPCVIALLPLAPIRHLTANRHAATDRDGGAIGDPRRFSYQRDALLLVWQAPSVGDAHKHRTGYRTMDRIAGRATDRRQPFVRDAWTRQGRLSRYPDIASRDQIARGPFSSLRMAQVARITPAPSSPIHCRAVSETATATDNPFSQSQRALMGIVASTARSTRTTSS